MRCSEREKATRKGRESWVSRALLCSGNQGPPPSPPREPQIKRRKGKAKKSRSLMLSLSFCRCFTGVVPAKRSPKLVVSTSELQLFFCVHVSSTKTSHLILLLPFSFHGSCTLIISASSLCISGLSMASLFHHYTPAAPPSC